MSNRLLLVALVGQVAVFGIAGCSREASLSPPETRAASSIPRVANLSGLVVRDQGETRPNGECWVLPDAIVDEVHHDLRNVSYAIPSRKSPSRRVLVSFDRLGSAVLLSDLRRGPDPLAIEVDLRRGTGYVVGKPSEGGGSVRSRWTASADAILAEPTLGDLKGMIEFVKARCGT